MKLQDLTELQIVELIQEDLPDITAFRTALLADYASGEEDIWTKAHRPKDWATPKRLLHLPDSIQQSIYDAGLPFGDIHWGSNIACQASGIDNKHSYKAIPFFTPNLERLLEIAKEHAIPILEEKVENPCPYDKKKSTHIMYHHWRVDFYDPHDELRGIGCIQQEEELYTVPFKVIKEDHSNRIEKYGSASIQRTQQTTTNYWSYHQIFCARHLDRASEWITKIWNRSAGENGRTSSSRVAHIGNPLRFYDPAALR